jgi:hypothetical protein
MNEAMKKYHRDWYHAHWDSERRRRKERLRKNRRFVTHVIAEIKLILGCYLCGFDKNPYALDFHHRDAKEKSFEIASYASRGIQTVLKEIAKCDVVCANCHRILTHASNDGESANSKLRASEA